MRIDHVIFATRDLEATSARLEAEYGLRASGGGRHEGLGTHNQIVPLGGGYLEILAVADAAEAARPPLGRAVVARIAQAGEGLRGGPSPSKMSLPWLNDSGRRSPRSRARASAHG